MTHSPQELLQHVIRLTLFTRPNCGLCSDAKMVIHNLSKKRPLAIREVDVMASGEKYWRDLYEFDTPVLHVQRVLRTFPKPEALTSSLKLMHRFSESQVEHLIDEAENASR